MLDFTPVRNREMTIVDLAATVTKDDLRTLTNEMIDDYLAAIADARDEDVVFVPQDPHAHDPGAKTPEEVRMAWTLGHVIVHTTAGSEEAAFLAAELARGVELHGRSRYEVPWTTMKTVSQLRQRLEESRRMRLASLDMWPDEPHLDVYYIAQPPSPNAGLKVNAIARFLQGLMHEDSHRAQVREILRQAREADYASARRNATS
ncbi:MAG: hypothetical protein KatS3mg060_2460 [Dehalococcoidia bacterium]|nr:MAG: hypothetical protein KatS3mg060_2460 [Dehalococcoidia bacterium]